MTTIELFLDGVWVDVSEHHIPAEPCGCTPHRECDKHDLEADLDFERRQVDE